MMRNNGYLKKVVKILKTGIGTVGIIGVMMSSTIDGAPIFKLKDTKEYFEDPKSLALLNAALAGDSTKAKELAAKGANPNIEGPRNNPYNRLRLLHYAIAADNKKAITILIGVGADPELNTLGGAGPAFLFAMSLDKVDVLSLLLDLRPLNTLSHDTVDHLLFRSVALPRPRCLDLLLNKGAPIDFPDEAGYTIMMRAIDANDYQLAEYLINRGASVHIEAKGGMTPAYSIQYDLQKYKPGSPPYKKALHIKELMEAHGAVFPALSPAEVRANRAKQ